jgi:prolyl oligopeptidase
LVQKGQWFVASVANGDGGDFAHFIRDTDGNWRQLTRFEHGIKGLEIGRDNALYLVSLDKAPRGKILRLPLAEADLAKAQLIVPEQKGVVTEIAPCDHGIYVSYLMGGPFELRYFRKGARARNSVLPVSAVAGEVLARGSAGVRQYQLRGPAPGIFGPNAAPLAHGSHPLHRRIQRCGGRSRICHFPGRTKCR